MTKVYCANYTEGEIMGSPWAEKKLKPRLVVGKLKEFKAQFYFIRKLDQSFLF